MASKSPKADLNIYLAKPETADPAQIIKDMGTLKGFELQINSATPCTLFIKNSHSNPPRWARLFSKNVSISEFGQNSSTGAALYIKIKDSIFVMTFGQGHHLVDTANIEMNFGLKTALNLLDVASIRSIDKSSFEEHPTQTREQTGIATELQYFGVNIERDLLRAITGKPNDEKYGARISGMDALKLSVEAQFDSLGNLLENILAVYQSNSYKNGPFAWIDHIGEVKDKSSNDALDGELLNRINLGNHDRIWLSVPEIIDWDRVVGFKYSGAGSSPRVHDIRISGFLETIKDKTLDLQTLKQRKIFCVDADDQPIYERPAYRFVYAEMDYQSEVYVLNNGKWYKVNRGFADQVSSFFGNVAKYEKPLPTYNDDTEGVYNKRVAGSDVGSFVLLDQHNIQVTGAASPVEPCDLLRDGNEFIHVKRYGGSSVLSHLFNQGLVSGELFQMEPEFRRILNSKLPAKFKLADPNNRPGTNEYQVVFAIVSESDDHELSIPFFSKISLRHVMTRLQAIGFDVTLAKISVDDTRKKTKKYRSK